MQDVAKKYKAADEATLVAKVKAGGKGVWGQIPMPPNAAVKEDDVKTLVKWISPAPSNPSLRSKEDPVHATWGGLLFRRRPAPKRQFVPCGGIDKYGS